MNVVRTTRPNRMRMGIPAEVRLKAIQLYLEGNSFRSIDRLLQVNHQSVANWVKVYSERLPTAQVPKKPKVAELDELFTFIGKKKTNSMCLQ
jgi:transposase-like protein